MSKIYLDFESRSRVDIWQVGAYAYSVHPSTEILCLAYAIDNGPVEIIKKDDLGLVCPIKIEGNLFSAFNALFENFMWNNIMVKKWGWPRIPIKQFRCVMAKSLASAYPQSLTKACLAIDSPYKKSTEGHTMMLKLSKPNIRGDWNENPKDFEKLYQYCIDDVMAERSLDQMLPDLNPSEQTIWFLDQLINQRGIYIDKEAVIKALSFIDEYTKRLNNIVYEQSNTALDRVTRRQAVLDWCKSQGVDISSYTKSAVTKILEDDSLPKNVRTILEAKLALGKTSIAKYHALKEATTQDGRLRDTLIYHGAATGRWTGKLFQLHNLPKGTVADTEAAISLLKKAPLEDFEILYPEVMDVLSSCIRGMIISAPGTELFVGDFNAIEARVVMWLAGEEFKDGIYEDMARRIYGKQDINKKERQLGKIAILAMGYGMGKVKFEATCASQGVIISPELAEKAVNTYRETYAKIRQMWYDQENAALDVVTSSTNLARIKIIPPIIGWSIRNKNLLGHLPSGRYLTYPEARVEYIDTSWGDRKLTLTYMAVDVKNQWTREKTYGGKIVENITQAVARDILAEAMLRLEKNGYPVIFSVHDEIVCEVPESKGDLNEFQGLLCKNSAWATGLSIKAECWQGKRYKKT